MKMNKGIEQPKKQLDLFSEQNFVHQQDTGDSETKNQNKELEAEPAKVVQFSSLHLSEIYERILNRTMS